MGGQLAAPYHSGCFADAGEALRPGGLDLTRRALRYADFGTGQTVVDLGCGEATGTDLLRRSGCLAIGVDLSMRALTAAAARQAALSLVAADAVRLPFADGSLDGLLAECVLSLTGFSCAALTECHRVLRSGGHLAVTDVFARAQGVCGNDSAPLACCHAGQDEIIARLIEAGFRIDRWEDHSAVLKTFIARLIFQSGSLDGLWGGTVTGDAALRLNASLRQSRPGYFLLIASKAGKGYSP